METFIGNKLNSVLQKEVKHFRNYMLDIDYEEFKDYSKEKMFSLYVYSLIENPIGLKKVKTKCLQNSINAKQFNEFIYLSMKWKRKQERGIYSWFEADYFDIDIEEWNESTLTYTVL
tara:strand:- start:80 stop:430 length:351 start_codon:yes stop_codon:yes gene_type:complete